MDTFPGSPPAAVRADLALLRTSLDASGIPTKALDRNVLVGTWNIRGFGKVLDKWEAAAPDSPKRSLRDVLCLAEIVSRFDVVALQEVKRDLGGLRRLMQALGPNWGWTLTDFTRGEPGNQERMGVIYLRALRTMRELEEPNLRAPLIAHRRQPQGRRGIRDLLGGATGPGNQDEAFDHRIPGWRRRMILAGLHLAEQQ